MNIYDMLVAKQINGGGGGGGITPTGEIEITAPGQYDVTNYASANATYQKRQTRIFFIKPNTAIYVDAMTTANDTQIVSTSCAANTNTKIFVLAPSTNSSLSSVYLISGEIPNGAGKTLAITCSDPSVVPKIYEKDGTTTKTFVMKLNITAGGSNLLFNINVS